MNTQAKLKVKTLFENRFNKEKFVSFIADLLNEVENDTSFPPLRGTYIKAPFQNGIHEYERVCKYIDSLGNQIDVLIVKLKDKSKLENARTFQRNFIVDYLNGGRKGKFKDGALVAFYSDDSSDWRFSFVKLEYELKEESGKIIETKKMTSAKRYSFLVGANENSHTAQSQLLPLLEDDVNNPNLKQIEQVFGVETVTKEFFEKYKELFLRVVSELEDIVKSDEKVREDFKTKEINIGDFAKKLLGQIVFLYFLQKKGWFGVERGKSWGTGSKSFLRDLFNKKVINYTNFFNNVLEPLFYEALATDRSVYDHFSSHFNSRIPFLNGGLFDPISNYDWINTDINIPDELFSNNNISQDKHKDIGTGILDVFDRYNFTVREDEPLEKEVAIDPEMLGKVFENMLEVKDRKSKGTYYTPREIVHYMCQESLINYLESNLSKVSRDDLIYLVKKAEYDKEKEQAGVEGVKTYEINSKFPEKLKVYSSDIDSLLADIKVCDPAIGSGAFPVGMMNEIVKARSILTEFVPYNSNRSEYEFKRHAIANSIHGVDIDQGAVEIAKLRLWLSLIVDEDDISNIKPLPNLDYKIMQGNSLIEEFEGIKLFDDSLLNNNENSISQEVNKLKDRQQDLQKKYFETYHDKTRKDETDQIYKELEQIKKRLIDLNKPKDKNNAEINLFKSADEATEKADQLQILQKKFFEASQKTEKERIKQQIDDLIWDLIETTVRHEGNIDKLAHIQKIRKSNNKPFFLWKLNFADVFKEKGGFDVVIANPPYVGNKGHKDEFQIIQEGNMGKYYERRMDLYYFFFHLALDIQRMNGNANFITTNYFLTSTSGRKLREDLHNRSQILEIINFNELKIFESALGQHNSITLFSKSFTKKMLCKMKISDKKGYLGEKEIESLLQSDPVTVKQELLFENGYINSVKENILPIITKIRHNAIPLLLICNINTGIQTGADKISEKHIHKYKLKKNKGDGVFILSKKELSEKEINLKDEHVKPWFKNSNISQYLTDVITEEYVLYFKDRKSKQNINASIFKHFEEYKTLLTERLMVCKKNKFQWNIVSKWINRGEYYLLFYPRKQEIFESPKIVVPQRSPRNTFGYNEIPWYASADVYFITQKDLSYSLKYLLALLNSKLYYIWLYNKGKRKGENLELYQKPLSEIPVRMADESTQKTFIAKTDQILSLIQTDDYLTNQNIKARVKLLQKEIDQMIYKLYELSDEEIKIVEEETKHLY